MDIQESWQYRYPVTYSVSQQPELLSFYLGCFKTTQVEAEIDLSRKDYYLSGYIIHPNEYQSISIFVSATCRHEALMANIYSIYKEALGMEIHAVEAIQFERYLRQRFEITQETQL